MTFVFISLVKANDRATEPATEKKSEENASYISLSPFEEAEYSSVESDLNFSPKQEDFYIVPNMENRKKSRILGNSLFTSTLISFAALNAADCLSTSAALKYPSLKEANPVMKPFSNNMLAFTSVKIGITALNYVLLKNLYKKNKTMAWAVSLVSNFAMTYVVVHNYRMIQNVKS